jgi:hypothetical protein
VEKTKRPSVSILKVILVLAIIMIVRHSSTSSMGGQQPQAVTTMATKAAVAMSHDARLWESYTTDSARKAAIQRVLPYIGELVGAVQANQNNIWKTRRFTLAQACNTTTVGSGYGAHNIWDFPYSTVDPCVLISFGINNDYSFDTDMADRWQCRGFASDPTVIHKSSLHKIVTFHNLGATMLKEEPGVNQKWVSVSMPTLVNQVLRVKHVNVLKMDCEGCEFALARDVVREDPGFFNKVDQLTIELHVSKKWIPDEETLYHLGLLYELLKEAGLELQNLLVGGCSLKDEEVGCIPQLEALGFPCGINKLYGSTGGIRAITLSLPGALISEPIYYKDKPCMNTCLLIVPY